MYRAGHYGVSLLVYAPVLAVLLATGYRAAAVAGLVGVLVLAPVPDYDQRVPFVSHRGPTHTFAFAGLVGAAFAGVVLLAPVEGVARLPLAAFAFGVGALGIVAHLAGDVLTPAGIEPFWPLSSRNYSLYLTRADNTLANYLVFCCGVAATVGVYVLFV
ncbi:metal-dependent hydrolase [Halospeciosus flavus]|uniref:Metal-dependent hydrolase n=1 Tax=Halospeciosus flavus TaxID=3032283 RepID=A0ABD5Z4D1_9EURY|nr:metal-dependent hydrolase [Halospeciosus flavus]